MRLTDVEIVVSKSPRALLVGEVSHLPRGAFRDCNSFDDNAAYLTDGARLTERDLFTKRRLVLRGADSEVNRVGSQRFFTRTRWTATLTRVGWMRHV